MARNKEDEARHKILCAHLHNAFSTRSGQVALQWLKENCFMAEPMQLEAAESAPFNYRVNARRDLFIVLEQFLKEGIIYAGTDTQYPNAS